MFFDAPYLQNEFGYPRFFFFFYVFNIILSFSNCSQSFINICTWELLGANVFKFENWVKYANEMTDDIIYSTQYYIEYGNRDILRNL